MGGVRNNDLQLLHKFIYFFAYFCFILNVIFIVIFFLVGGTFRWFKRRTRTGTVSYIPILINLLTGVKAQEAGGIWYIYLELLNKLT